MAVTRIYLRTLTKLHYEKAKSGQKVTGLLSGDPSKAASAILGKEVDDLTDHADQTTEYRKFILCKLRLAENICQAEIGKFYYEAEDRINIWIYF